MKFKLIYLNVVMLLVFIAGITLSIVGLCKDFLDWQHTIIIDSIAIPCVSGSIWYWKKETEHIFRKDFKKNVIINKVDKQPPKHT